MAYEVHLEVFDGPFDLLLQLISQQQVEIYEIRLADIVDAFVAEMNRAETLDLDTSTEFLLIAATLVELKCRRLLPGPDDVDLEDELALYEARDYLLARLVEAGSSPRRRRAGRRWKAAPPARRRVAAAPTSASPTSRPTSSRVSTPERLAAVCAAAFVERPIPRIGDAHVLTDEVSVATTLEQLSSELAERGRATLSRPHRPPAVSGSRRRLLPGAARAVQARAGRARPDRDLR